MDHLAGVRLIPANQFDTGMEWFASDSSGGKLAVLINIPGSFKNLLDRFEAPLEKADASGRDVIQSTNLEEIFVFVAEDGYEIFYLSLTPGTPGAVVDKRAVLGGYRTMADGMIAKLYSLSDGGSFASYNSVTENAYVISSGTPVSSNFHV